MAISNSRLALLKGALWGPRVGRLCLDGLILCLWLWLYRPVFDYLRIIFSAEDFRTNQIVLIGIVALIFFRARQGRLGALWQAAPRLYWPALGLALGGSALYLLAERYLDINTLSASLFGLASYGMLGLWMRPQSWRQGLPAALLLIGALPFGDHLQTYVGYPLRLITAAIVRDGLGAAGVRSVGIDTILVLENSVAQVDLPCSGVKSLWTGGLFLLAATWVERRAIGWRWGIVAAIMAGLLFIANLMRVGALVLVGQVAGWRLAAQMLHVPLGVLGFGAACLATVGLLRWVPPHRDGPAGQPVAAQPRWLGPGLAVCLLGFALAYTPRPQTGLTQAAPLWQFPPGLTAIQEPLHADEVAWMTREGVDSADRRRIAWQDLTGSMVLITSRTWRAQHRPERCFEVLGLSIDTSETFLAGPDFPVHVMVLSRQGEPQASAAYWFQSASRLTDDYGSRIWADLAVERERWVLVTILIDGPHDPRAGDVQGLYQAVRQAVARGLEGGIAP